MMKKLLMMVLAFACQSLSAQSIYMSCSEAKDKDEIASLEGGGGALILSRRNDLVVTVGNAPTAKVTPKGRRADGYYGYEVVVAASDTKTPKVEVNKRGDVDKIDFVVNVRPDFLRAYVVEEVEKPIRMEDQTKANDVITDATHAQVEVTSSIADLQFDCPKDLGCVVAQAPKAGDKSVTVTTITFPVKPLTDAKAEVARLEAELADMDAKVKAQTAQKTLSDAQIDHLLASYDQRKAELETALEQLGKLSHIGLFATGTNSLSIDIAGAVPRKKFCWGVLLRTVTVEKHVTDFNAKFSEGARLYGLRDYANARSNFVAASQAKDAEASLLPSVQQNIAECDTCLLYERYAMQSLARMKEMKAKGSGTQAEVARYATGASEFLKVLNKYNPCDFYTDRIEKLEKLVADMPLDLKFTLTRWERGYEGLNEAGPLAGVELWADYGADVPPLNSYDSDRRFTKLVSASPSRYRQLATSGSGGVAEIHLVRKSLPQAIFFRPVGADDKIKIKRMNVADIMQQSVGSYNKRQFRLKMYVDD